MLSVVLLTACTCMIALLDQSQCSSSYRIEFFTKLFSNSPLQEVKCFPKNYKDNALISNSSMHWTLLVLSTQETAMKLSDSLSQPGGTFQSYEGLPHGHNVVQACQQYWNLAFQKNKYKCFLPLAVVGVLYTICLPLKNGSVCVKAYSSHTQHFQKKSQKLFHTDFIKHTSFAISF